MKTISLRGYWINKFGVSKEGAEEIDTFLENLARYSLCEAHIVSARNSFFSDFFEITRNNALKSFDSYYRVIRDYKLDLGSFIKEGSYYGGMLKELDRKLIRLYWEIVFKDKVKDETLKETKEHLKDVLAYYTRFNKYIPSIEPLVIESIKSDSIKQYKRIHKNLSEIQIRNLENYEAISVLTMEELKKYTERFLKKKFLTTTFVQLVENEQWWFKGIFKEKLQVLFTNGLSLPENRKIMELFKSIDQKIERKASLNVISNLIYEYRLFIFKSLSTKEQRFYKNFIEEYQLKFKHDGIYKLSYFEDEIENFENLIMNLRNGQNTGIVDAVSEFADRVNKVVNQSIVKRNKRLEKKRKVMKKRYQIALLNQKKFSLKKQPPLPRFKESDYAPRSLKTHKGLKELKLIMESKELDLKASPISLTIALRKASMIIHLFAKETDFSKDEAKEMIRAFFIVFIDSVIILN